MSRLGPARRIAVPREEHFTSGLRSPSVTARVGLWLGICFAVAFVTGLLSHAAQSPTPWFPLPTRPSWGRTTFINGDARDVDYADGTVFYLYTPFKGSVLQTVLERLRAESQRRRIRVCTYGPGTLEVLPQEWLVSSDSWEPDIHRPTIYESR